MAEMFCIPCIRKKNELNNQLDYLRKQTKKRAENDGKTFAIYFDNEDSRFYACEIQTLKSRGYKAIEYVSKYT